MQASLVCFEADTLSPTSGVSQDLSGCRVHRLSLGGVRRGPRRLGGLRGRGLHGGSLGGFRGEAQIGGVPMVSGTIDQSGEGNPVFSVGGKVIELP